LHDDGGGNIGPLDSDIIEIIRDGYAECSQKEAVREIARGQLDALPALRSNKERSSTSRENVVRVCERISGSIGRSAVAPKGSFPVKTARPRTAQTPQQNAAEAMKK